MPQSLPSHDILIHALAQIKSVAEYVDSVKGQTESMENLLEIKSKLPHADLLLKPGRNLLLEGSAYLISISKDKGIEKVTSTSPRSISKLSSKLRKKSVYIYLFNDLLVITTKEKDWMLTFGYRPKTLKELARFESTAETHLVSMTDISKKR